MTFINYIVHSTSTDNEKGIVSGNYDCPLSSLGKRQAHELMLLLNENNNNFGTIYSSPSQRAYETASILFPQEKISIDPRLMEIDYGNRTHYPKTEIDMIRNEYVKEPFPNGESYEDVKKRMSEFLESVSELPIITIISHQAPQLALECFAKNCSFQTAFREDWRLKKNGWQPYWVYNI